MRVRRSPAPLLLLALALAACGPREVDEAAPVGPVVGHVDAGRAFVWYRPARPGTYALEVAPRDGDGEPLRFEAESLVSADRTVTWEARPLAPATAYAYAVRDAGGRTLERSTLRTAPAPGARARVRLAVGSCASLEDDPVWAAIRDARPDALVLLGDTPYVDATDLRTARAKHRAFLAQPSLAALLRSVPLWSTWDDHDYGADNANGTLAGKEETRRAYCEYRAQARYGEAGEGIQTRVRYGPVEVFLLDARSFAGLEPLPSAPESRSCLGTRQRAWIEDALRASEAPFKLIANGMVWHDKGGRSQDDWASYAAERDGLFAFLGEAPVPGCVLLGGDVHACQHAVFEDTAAGYPLHELVVSPLHGRAWRGGDRRHEARRWGTVEPHAFLLLDADTTGTDAVLVATWMRADGGVLHRVVLPARDLAPPGPLAPGGSPPR
jgi:alkaline phosphatase D